MRPGVLIHGGGALCPNDHLLGTVARINRTKAARMAATGKRRKEPRGKNNPREQILDAAAHCFSRADYGCTSVAIFIPPPGSDPALRIIIWRRRKKCLALSMTKACAKKKSKVAEATAHEG